MWAATLFCADNDKAVLDGPDRTEALGKLKSIGDLVVDVDTVAVIVENRSGKNMPYVVLAMNDGSHLCSCRTLQILGLCCRHFWMAMRLSCKFRFHIGIAVVVVDSYIQGIVLAAEETTVTQQVSHRPIECRSRLWSQRGTKVNGSHHGDNPLLRPTGIQIATKSYTALQAMAPTNIKTVHQTSLLHIESNLDRLGMLSPTHDQRSQQKKQKNYAPTSFDQQVQVSQGHTLYRNKKK